MLVSVGLWHYVFLAVVLFSISLFGVILNRRNIIIFLMAVEVMLLAANLLFVVFGKYYGDIQGEVFALFVLAIAAAEAAIGLAIILAFFRKRGTVEIKDMGRLKG